MNDYYYPDYDELKVTHHIIDPYAEKSEYATCPNCGAEQETKGTGNPFNRGDYYCHKCGQEWME